MKIGIILDNPKREIDGILLVAYHLIRLNHDIFIIPMYQQGYDVPWLALDAIIVNYARLNNLGYLKAYKEMGITIFVLDNEGGVIAEKGVNAPSNPSVIDASGANNYVDHYMFWGRTQYESFKEYGNLGGEKLHVTGCPRYDVCSKKWRSILEYGLKGYILVNTNFSALNPLFTRTEERERMAFILAGWDKDYITSLLDDMRSVFIRYLDTISEIADRNKEKTFLVRPHPFEDQSIYDKTFSKHRNVVVDGSGSVFNVINNASCVIHLNCQTAVETILLGKLSISLEFLNTERLRQHYPLPSMISYSAASLDELEDIVKSPEKYVNMNSYREIHEKYIDPWFSKNDGFASERVADIVSSKTTTNSYAYGRYWYGKSFRDCLEQPRLARLIQGIPGNIFGSKFISDIRRRLNKRRNTKYINVDLVLRNLSKIAETDNRSVRFNVDHSKHPITRLSMASIRVSAHSK